MIAEPVILGRIVGAFGVRGWVKVFSYTDPREAVLQYQDWLLSRKDSWQPVRVAEGQRHGKSVIARLEDVDDRNAAEALIGTDIGVRRDAMPTPEEGRYYWSDLQGLTVVHRDGAVLGRIDHLLETGANDVMVVEGERQRLIPFVRDEVVLDVNLDEGRVVVDWQWD